MEKNTRNHLFQPLSIKSVTLRNRIGVAPMCMYSSEDGFVNDWHMVHLGSRAVGGAGLVIMEATAVEPRGRLSPSDTGIWSDAHIEPLKRITSFIKKQGAVPAIQLSHGGRKACRSTPWEGQEHLSLEEGGWDTVGPSAIPFGTYRMPHALNVDEIKEIIESFSQAAKRANEAGFDWLEIHGAHGYLVHEFLSPFSNKRNDEYGGNFENRIRFLLELIEGVKKTWPNDKPLAVRISAVDWADGGWTIDDSVELAKRLKLAGVDLVDCSSGSNVPNEDIPVGAGYQVPFAEQIRKEAGIMTAAVGLITEPMQADELIRNGRADIVLLARELLRNPYWPLYAAKVLDMKEQASVPKQYRWAH